MRHEKLPLRITRALPRTKCSVWRIGMKNVKKKKIPVWKKLVLALESLVIVVYLVMTFFFVWLKVDKKGFISYFATNPLVRMYLNNTTKKDYVEKVQDTNYQKEKVVVNEGLSEEIETYRNIALFGIDSRGSEFEDSAHSDTIIVMSINNKTHEVRMASIYRDTMLKIVDDDGDVSYTKCNSAFFKAGPECAVNMLNTNLDLNITDYVVVNFNGIANIIDALGGIEVNLTPDEQFYVNGYLTETRLITGMDAPDIYQNGENIHLSGLQATAYCRIRYVAFYDEDGTVYNNDMGRTARQRSVIKKLVAKAKDAGVGQVLNIANTILNYNTEDEKIIGTSLSFDEVMDMIPTLIDFSLTGSEGFPFTCDTPTINGASMVVAQGLSYNVTKLHEFLFDEKNYVPSNTVNNISDYLETYTGIPTVRLPEDREKDNSSDYGYSDYDSYDEDDDYEYDYN